MAKTEHMVLLSLDKVEEDDRKINELYEQSKDIISKFIELIGIRNEHVAESKAEATNIKNTMGISNFVSQSGNTGINVQTVAPIKSKGAQLMTLHGKTIIEECPRAVSLVLSEATKTTNMRKLLAKGIDINEYRDLPENRPVCTSKDKMIKVIAETMEYILDSVGAAHPESPYTLEQWYTVLEQLKEATNE